MTPLDLPGVRLYGPVETRVSSQAAAPRYFLGKWHYANRRASRLSREDIPAIRAWARQHPELTKTECCRALQRQYGVDWSTIKNILANESWSDRQYTPGECATIGPVSALDRAWLWLMIWIWLCRLSPEAS